MFLFVILFKLAFSGTLITSYLEMELPKGFSCQDREASMWVCLLDGNINDFNVVTNAVSAGPYDNIAGFMRFFAKEFKGATKKAKYMYVKTRTINGQTWVEAQHEDSEKVGYITRYLLTAKDANSFIVVFNIKKNLTKKYAPQLYAMVQSLKLRSGFKAKKKNKALSADGLLGYLKVSRLKTSGKKVLRFARKVGKDAGIKDDDTLIYILIGIGALIASLLLIRKIKKRKRKKQFF